jgi:hypothetical protein
MTFFLFPTRRSLALYDFTFTIFIIHFRFNHRRDPHHVTSIPSFIPALYSDSFRVVPLVFMSSPFPCHVTRIPSRRIPAVHSRRVLQLLHPSFSALIPRSDPWLLFPRRYPVSRIHYQIPHLRHTVELLRTSYLVYCRFLRPAFTPVHLHHFFSL